MLSIVTELKDLPTVGGTILWARDPELNKIGESARWWWHMPEF